jgi:hypothetical protein
LKVEGFSKGDLEEINIRKIFHHELILRTKRRGNRKVGWQCRNEKYAEGDSKSPK